MQCPKCKSENDAHQKFCKSCGSPMGLVCDRCGSLNRPEDRFCGNCAHALLASLKPGEPSVVVPMKQHLISVKQYAQTEIEELLLLRRALQDERHTTIMTQNDIDKLFE